MALFNRELLDKAKKEKVKTNDDKYFDAMYYVRKRDMSSKLKGYEIIKEMALEGDVRAQVSAGEFCDYVLKEPKKAFKWFEMAVEQNDLAARYYYAGMLLRGEPIKKNRKLAIKMYSDLADEGVGEAMYVLGQLDEEEGRYEDAATWYEKAYHAGFAPSQKKLKKMYKDGLISKRRLEERE